MTGRSAAPLGRVLITGGGGKLGRPLVAGLPSKGWDVRVIDLADGPRGVSEWIVGDAGAPGVLDAALDEVDAVVHLAGISVEAPFQDLLPANIDGTYQLFEACRRAGVSRVVYASSHHAVGRTPRADAIAGSDLRPRPDTFYGVTKVFGEALASLYADRYGMRVACLRIGTCLPEPLAVRHLSTWLSPGDAVRLVHACLTSARLRYDVVYGTSDNTRAWWDLQPARELGYQPQDDAEVYAETVLSRLGPLPADHPDALYLGGTFVTDTTGEPWRDDAPRAGDQNREDRHDR